MISRAHANGIGRPERGSLEQQLRQTIAELDLVSHISAISLDTSGRDTSDDIGGRRPTGATGDGRKSRDRSENGGGSFYEGPHEFPLKSADHFRKRASKAFSEHAMQKVLDDARASLEAWKRRPLPTGEPEYGSPQWKHWVAQSPLPDGDIARKFNVSRQYVNRIRTQYRDAA